MPKSLGEKEEVRLVSHGKMSSHGISKGHHSQRCSTASLLITGLGLVSYGKRTLLSQPKLHHFTSLEKDLQEATSREKTPVPAYGSLINDQNKH